MPASRWLYAKLLFNLKICKEVRRWLSPFGPDSLLLQTSVSVCKTKPAESEGKGGQKLGPYCRSYQCLMFGSPGPLSGLPCSRAAGRAGRLRLGAPLGKPCLFSDTLGPYKISFLINLHGSTTAEIYMKIIRLSAVVFHWPHTAGLTYNLTCNWTQRQWILSSYSVCLNYPSIQSRPSHFKGNPSSPNRRKSFKYEMFVCIFLCLRNKMLWVWNDMSTFYQPTGHQLDQSERTWLFSLFLNI